MRNGNIKRGQKKIGVRAHKIEKVALFLSNQKKMMFN